MTILLAHHTRIDIDKSLPSIRIFLVLHPSDQAPSALIKHEVDWLPCLMTWRIDLCEG